MLEKVDYLNTIQNKTNEIKKITEGILQIIRNKKNKSKYANEQAEALINYASFQENQEKNFSYHFLMDAKKILEKNDLTNTLNYYKILKYIGMIFFSKQQYNTALLYFQKALEFGDKFSTNEDDEELSSLLNQVGIVHQSNNNLVEAIKCFNLARKTDNKLNCRKNFTYTNSLLELAMTIEGMKINQDLYIKLIVEIEKQLVHLINLEYGLDGIKVEARVLKIILTHLVEKQRNMESSKYYKRMMLLNCQINAIENTTS